ncbi:Putative uncharacterized protein [Lactococcus lactis subsp. lactis A12]|uniref:Uncharacterized protein n=1 Tax=Lactococcus lactis subsp. lactis A12 TaxID=1137134 RepID=S6ERX9_LACLL|nr:Putative uncharacterized protein [Lactococcus lactis subsp. lactis A12]
MQNKDKHVKIDGVL